MLLRKALMAALVVAPIVYSPAAVSAQRGLDRAAVATQHADEVGAGQHSHARQDMPRGILRRFADRVLPPGIRRTRHHEDSEPATEPDTGSTDTDTGTTDPGTTDPGTTDPGTTDPGTTDPGTTEPVCLAYQNVLVGFTYQQVCVLWGSL